VSGTGDHRVTQLLAAVGRGDRAASAELMPLIYEHLRALAGRRMAHEPPGQTLQATALVHEAYLRLFGDGAGEADWSSRFHFYAAAAEAMRRILVDQARQRRSKKRGGDRRRVPLNRVEAGPDEEPVDHLALDHALEELKTRDQTMYDVAMLRHFCGLTNEQAARALGVSPRTTKRKWSVAQLCLQETMKKAQATEGVADGG
jgi:RNA polymerase sigma factor (TIGR02999 family)